MPRAVLRTRASRGRCAFNLPAHAVGHVAEHALAVACLAVIGALAGAAAATVIGTAAASLVRGEHDVAAANLTLLPGLVLAGEALFRVAASFAPAPARRWRTIYLAATATAYLVSVRGG